MLVLSFCYVMHIALSTSGEWQVESLMFAHEFLQISNVAGIWLITRIGFKETLNSQREPAETTL